MKILAVDTSAKVLSVALCDDEKLIAQTTLNTGNTHSETILAVTDELLKKAGIEVRDIDLFSCSNGPGSFTGIRIGVSFIKGIAFGTNKPCVGVSTLEALAYNLKDYSGVICPVMDARRSQLYNALFRSDGVLIKRLVPDRLISASELEKELEIYDMPIYFCGDGYNIASSEIKNRNIRNTNLFSTHQSAYSVAQTALDKYRSGGSTTDRELLPVYLRASQAERELAEKKKSEVIIK